MKRLQLYLDDSGSRHPDREATPRKDGMDCFAFGGILIDEGDVGAILAAHADLSARWKLQGPLHSTKIRGRRGAFAWLANDEGTEGKFLSDLEGMILGLPLVALACVIHRPGYVARYKDRYAKPWLLCKTALAILIERAAKHAHRCAGQLEIFYEEAGKQEDRDLVEYVRALKAEGMPFAAETSKGYDGLKARDFQTIVLGEPRRVTKAVPMAQIADLVLYPIAKSGYDRTYGPYARMCEKGKILDALLKPEECASLGIKYSCFDGPKNEGPARTEPSSGLHNADPGALPTNL